MFVVALYAGNVASEPAKAAQTLGIQHIPPDIGGFRMREYYFKNVVAVIYSFILGYTHPATVARMLYLMGLGKLFGEIAALRRPLTDGSFPRVPRSILLEIWSRLTVMYVIKRGWKCRGFSERITTRPQDAVQDVNGRGFNFTTVLCALGVIVNTGSTRSLVRAGFLGFTMFTVALLQICCECIDQCPELDPIQ